MTIRSRLRSKDVAATASRYLSRVHLAVASVPSWNNWAKIPFDTQIVQDGPADIWSAVNKRWTPVVAGYYRITVRVRTGSAGPTVAGVGKNGAVVQATGADAGGSVQRAHELPEH